MNIVIIIQRYYKKMAYSSSVWMLIHHLPLNRISSFADTL